MALLDIPTAIAVVDALILDFHALGRDAQGARLTRDDETMRRDATTVVDAMISRQPAEARTSLELRRDALVALLLALVTGGEERMPLLAQAFMTN